MFSVKEVHIGVFAPILHTDQYLINVVLITPRGTTVQFDFHGSSPQVGGVGLLQRQNSLSRAENDAAEKEAYKAALAAYNKEVRRTHPDWLPWAEWPNGHRPQIKPDAHLKRVEMSVAGRQVVVVERDDDGGPARKPGTWHEVYVCGKSTRGMAGPPAIMDMAERAVAAAQVELARRRAAAGLQR